MPGREQPDTERPEPPDGPELPASTEPPEGPEPPEQPPPTQPPESQEDGYDWHKWYAVATTFVAPATFVSALLFYFGYVYSRASFLYFGLDIDTVGLSTQAFVMRSPQALLVPAILLTLGACGATLVHVMVLRRGVAARVSGAAHYAGIALTVTALAMVAAYGWIGDWWPYAMVTPLTLAAGIGLLAWAGHHRGVRRSVVALGALIVGISVFWATATLAEWTGRGAAQRVARDLGSLPAVVLDTKERLYLGDGIVEETVLPAEEGQSFRYRYRGLRLLIQGGDKMFLVPSPWTAAGSTLVVPVDSNVRVKFRFVDDPP